MPARHRSPHAVADRRGVRARTVQKRVELAAKGDPMTRLITEKPRQFARVRSRRPGRGLDRRPDPRVRGSSASVSPHRPSYGCPATIFLDNFWARRLFGLGRFRSGSSSQQTAPLRRCGDPAKAAAPAPRAAFRIAPAASAAARHRAASDGGISAWPKEWPDNLAAGGPARSLGVAAVRGHDS